MAPGQVKIREPVGARAAHQLGREDREVNDQALPRPVPVARADQVQARPKGQEPASGFPKQELRGRLPRVLRSRSSIRRRSDGPRTTIARAVVVVVSGRPKVLLIEAREERDARYLEQALRDEEIQVEVRPPIGFPRGAERSAATTTCSIISDVLGHGSTQRVSSALSNATSRTSVAVSSCSAVRSRLASEATTARRSRMRCPCACRSRRRSKSRTWVCVLVLDRSGLHGRRKADRWPRKPQSLRGRSAQEEATRSALSCFDSCR